MVLRLYGWLVLRLTADRPELTTECHVEQNPQRSPSERGPNARSFLAERLQRCPRHIRNYRRVSVHRSYIGRLHQRVYGDDLESALLLCAGHFFAVLRGSDSGPDHLPILLIASAGLLFNFKFVGWIAGCHADQLTVPMSPRCRAPIESVESYNASIERKNAFCCPSRGHQRSGYNPRLQFLSLTVSPAHSHRRAYKYPSVLPT